MSPLSEPRTTGGSAIDPETLRREVAGIRWHHTIDLGQGVVTPGRDNTPRKLGRLHLPASLAGKTVLDVGAWDGFFSFEAEARGASRVLATDSFIWDGGCEWASKAGFDLARRALGSGVEEMKVDVLELSPERVGTWDVVLFLGVLYHMKHPMLALEAVSSVTGEMLVLETLVDALGTRRPALAFYPGDEVAHDDTNWFGPNPAAVVGMLKAVGFRRVEVVSGTRTPLFRIAKALWHRFRHGHPVWTGLRTDRIVVHAWK